MWFSWLKLPVLRCLPLIYFLVDEKLPVICNTDTNLLDSNSHLKVVTKKIKIAFAALCQITISNLAADDEKTVLAVMTS